MSQSAVDVELRLKLKDGASAGVQAATRTAEASAAKAASASERAAARAAAAAEAGAARQRTSYARLAEARETLGIRAERVIQREIAQTEAAYKRLQASGTLGFREQARAAEAMRGRVQALTKEMGELTKAQKAFGALKFGAAGVAGITAAGYTLKGPASAAMSFDERLGLLANTAYAERGADGRKVGEAQIREAVKVAIGTGMTKDEAMSALDTMVRDNQVGGIAGALKLLPYIGKVSTGSGTSAEQVASMMGGFIGSGYAKDVEGAKRLMGMSSSAATAGAFEKSDMAKHLPALLPAAAAAGLTGEDGFRRLLVLLQQARTTAGSSDEAARNVANLLPKLQSNDTATDFKKAGRGDLAAYLMNERAKGVDPLTAWQNVIDSEIAKNPNLKPAINRIQGAKTKEEQDAAITSLTGMAEGQSMGKFFQDMQARGALFGMRNKKVEKEVLDALGMSESIVETDYSYMADKSGVKARVARERIDMANIEAMDALTPAIARAAEMFGDLANKYPTLTGATVLATGALTAFAGAAGLATLALGGKGPVGAAIARTAAAVGGSAAAARVAGVAKVGGIGAVGAGVGGWALGQMYGEDSAMARYGSSVMTGAAAGATLGSVVPVIGTGIGALAGGGLGLLYEAVKDLARPDQKPVDVNATLQVGLAPGLVLQAQSMQTTGGTMRMNTGNVWHGAP